MKRFQLAALVAFAVALSVPATTVGKTDAGGLPNAIGKGEGALNVI